MDRLYAAGLLLAVAAVYALRHASLQGYEHVLLLALAPVLWLCGWYWRPLQGLLWAVLLAAAGVVGLYQGQLARAEQLALLRYLGASQSALLWMAVLLLLSAGAYWLAMLGRATAPARLAAQLAPRLAWLGVAMGLLGTLVRWHESHLLGPDVGYMPVSNLYEVLVLFCWLTTLLQLYYADRHGGGHGAQAVIGAFCMLVVSAALAFMLWYALARQAYEIQPLMPALDSWWMKLHVPANFIGYGGFSVAAMLALALLIGRRWPDSALARVLPPAEQLDDIMYQSIALGFAFFTVATILGALWAAEAWGAYWSWDPKETWALIVWLNYAAWLHMRMVKDLRGPLAAWWALLGLLVTGFAFMGVNLFLSGLHSYGEL